MPELRILQVCPNDKPPFLELCAANERAAALIGARTQTVFFAPTVGVPLPTARYLNVDSHGPRTLRRRLDALFPDVCFDLVLAHRYRGFISVARSALRYRQLVGVAHEFGMMTSRRRRLTRRYLAPGATLAGVSAAVMQELPAPRCVLPNPVDVGALEASALDREAARAALGIPSRQTVIGVIGRLHYKKRPLLAVDTFRKVHRVLDDAELVFLGDGDLRSELEERIAQIGLGASVSLKGNVPNARTLLRAFDAVLVCSSDAEAFGMVVAEAAALGVPVVAAPAPGPAEILGPVPGCADSATPEGLAAELVERLTDPELPDVLVTRIRECLGLHAHAERLAQLIAGEQIQRRDET